MDTWRVHWPDPSPELRRTARLCSRLRHPHLLQVRPYGRRDGGEYAIEHVRGSPLGELLRSQRELGRRTPPGIACRIGLQACGALQYLHTECDPGGQPLRLVHGGITPQTVWLTHGGEVKIVTLPWALQMGGSWEWTDETERDRRRYLSPEQLLGHEVTPQSDLFALGACLYELLSGDPALEEVGRSHVDPLHFRCPELPAVLCDTVMQALEQDPERRHASAARMRHALARCTRHLPPVSQLELQAWIAGLLESWSTEDGAMTAVHRESLANARAVQSALAIRARRVARS